MIQLLATGMTAVALLGGVAFILLWGRRKLAHMRPGSVHPDTLEVMSRIGLHANQGVAVVRVGRRFLLMSYGEGGARSVTELSSEDLGLEPSSGESEAAPATRSRVGGERWRRISVGMAVIGAAVFAPADGFAQLPVGAAPGVAGQSIVEPAQDPFDVDAALGAMPPVALQIGDERGGLRLDGSVGTVLVLGLLAFVPTLLLLTTSFTRILVVLHLLRQALGTQNTPPGHLLAGLALLLTTVVMAPTFEVMRVTAVDPWLAGHIDEGTMMTVAAEPIRAFMLEHTRESDLRAFLEISGSPAPRTQSDISNVVLMSAFVTSELRTAFEIGFAIFLPFVMIDLVVAAVLTSMGMFMLPPTMIALPCKLMLFVLMDGWSLVFRSLVESFF